MKFYVELQLQANTQPLPEDRFDALADALYDIDAGDPAVEDMDLTASLADSRAVVSMMVVADDPAEACVKALCAVRTAIHAIGDATPGWETESSVMRVAPADIAQRLFDPV
jgi:hypothetical protein